MVKPSRSVPIDRRSCSLADVYRITGVPGGTIRRWTRAALLLSCFVALDVRSADGQPADTLRYSEVTVGEMVLSTPRGDVALESGATLTNPIRASCLEYLGAPRPVEMGVTRTYTNRIELHSSDEGIVADRVETVP